MAEKQASKPRKLLSAKDFCGEGEPYSEVIVTISIRILGKGITRSRLAVNTYPDPALKRMAIKSLKEQNIENYGLNEDRIFGACLTEDFAGWSDIDKDYPKLFEDDRDRYKRECAQNMNEYVKRSVDWAIKLHEQGMAEAALNDAKTASPRPN